MIPESEPVSPDARNPDSTLVWWRAEGVTAVLPIRQPALASWDKAGSAYQQRLSAFLKEVDDGGALDHIRNVGKWAYLRLDVALPAGKMALKGHDVENYLTPLVHHLGKRDADLALVIGTKREARYDGEPSTLSIGPCAPAPAPDPIEMRLTGSSEKEPWKAAIRRTLLDHRVTPVPGPLEVHLAFRVGPGRSWWNLWKPAGDALGPLLGEAPDGREYHPEDHRIHELHLHHSVDPELGHDVQLGVGWNPPP